MNEDSDNSSILSQSETQMRKGMLVYCVLLLLKDGKVYTSEIIRALREAELIVVEGTLYPLLNRLATYQEREVQKAMAKGNESKVEKFLDLMQTFGIQDLTRTGKVAMPRK